MRRPPTAARSDGQGHGGGKGGSERDGCGPKRDEAGPEARLALVTLVGAVTTRLPPVGQAPVPPAVQVRRQPPPAFLTIVNTLPDFDFALIV